MFGGGMFLFFLTFCCVLLILFGGSVDLVIVATGPDKGEKGRILTTLVYLYNFNFDQFHGKLWVCIHFR